MTSPPDAGGLCLQSRISLESLSNFSATSTANVNCGVSSVCDINGAGKQSAVLPPTESQRPAEYILGTEHANILEGRTHSEERRRLAVAPLDPMPLEDELNFALSVEGEAILEDAFMVNREASVMMPPRPRFCAADFPIPCWSMLEQLAS